MDQQHGYYAEQQQGSPVLVEPQQYIRSGPSSPHAVAGGEDPNPRGGSGGRRDAPLVSPNPVGSPSGSPKVASSNRMDQQQQLMAAAAQQQLRQQQPAPAAQAPAPAPQVNNNNKNNTNKDGEEEPILRVGDVLRNWVITNRIGGGAFGETYTAVNTSQQQSDKGKPNPQEVCIKVERNDKRMVLRLEVLALKKVQSCPAVVRYISSGRHDDVNFLVMEKLGENLSELRRLTPNGAFELYTVLHIGICCIQAIQGIHQLGLVHRDVKPSNFVVGNTPETRRRVYLIDFGLAKRYRSSDGSMKPARENAGFRGTSRYASLNSHNHKELGRVDDLWSLLFMLVEFISGTLPWRKTKEKEAIAELKQAHVGPQLVSKLPREFTPFVDHLMSLGYESEPNYTFLINLLHKCRERRGYPAHKALDWEVGTGLVASPNLPTSSSVGGIVSTTAGGAGGVPPPGPVGLDAYGQPVTIAPGVAAMDHQLGGTPQLGGGEKAKSKKSKEKKEKRRKSSSSGGAFIPGPSAGSGGEGIDPIPMGGGHPTGGEPPLFTNPANHHLQQQQLYNTNGHSGGVVPGGGVMMRDDPQEHQLPPPPTFVEQQQAEKLSAANQDEGLFVRKPSSGSRGRLSPMPSPQNDGPLPQRAGPTTDPNGSVSKTEEVIVPPAAAGGEPHPGERQIPLTANPAALDQTAHRPTMQEAASSSPTGPYQVGGQGSSLQAQMGTTSVEGDAGPAAGEFVEDDRPIGVHRGGQESPFKPGESGEFSDVVLNTPTASHVDLRENSQQQIGFDQRSNASGAAVGGAGESKSPPKSRSPVLTGAGRSASENGGGGGGTISPTQSRVFHTDEGNMAMLPSRGATAGGSTSGSYNQILKNNNSMGGSAENVNQDGGAGMGDAAAAPTSTSPETGGVTAPAPILVSPALHDGDESNNATPRRGDQTSTMPPSPLPRHAPQQTHPEAGGGSTTQPDPVSEVLPVSPAVGGVGDGQDPPTYSQPEASPTARDDDVNAGSPAGGHFPLQPGDNLDRMEPTTIRRGSSFGPPPVRPESLQTDVSGGGLVGSPMGNPESPDDQNSPANRLRNETLPPGGRSSGEGDPGFSEIGVADSTGPVRAGNNQIVGEDQRSDDAADAIPSLEEDRGGRKDRQVKEDSGCGCNCSLM